MDWGVRYPETDSAASAGTGTASIRPLTDTETGLYYYRARYYDPNAGRFYSEDPIDFDGAINFYQYVNNNPPIGVDPWGLSTLVFDRTTGMLYAFDKDNNFLFACTAGNRTVRSSKGPWPDGTFPYGYHNSHSADENGSFGRHGIYVFKVPGRPGMGVHSGRATAEDQKLRPKDALELMTIACRKLSI